MSDIGITLFPSFADTLTLGAMLAVFLASAWLGASTLPRRALAVVAVMLGAVALTTLLLRVVPGDPVVALLGEDAPEEARRTLAQDLELEDEHGRRASALAQTARALRGAGSALVLALAPASLEPALAAALPAEPRSFRTREPVRTVIGARLPATLALAGAAMLVALVLGVGLGVLAAARRGRVLGALAEAFSLAGAALPRFVIGPLLILAFAIGLRWLPPSGADDGARSLVLPALSLGTALAALLARMTRASLLEALSQDFVRTARAKGASPSRAVAGHALRSALIPVVTVLGLQLGGLLAGAVITEKIFVWPGVGLLLLESIRRLDVPVVQGVVLVVALGTALSTLLVDALVTVLDPRLRRRAHGGSA
jgi:peptide/nickel transport system permease protein